ncbi:MAG TPA: SMC family ATPase [Thermoleophilia bacterium]|nr:SMC family ATPase [Thermoleophilia bacterium]
MRPLRVVMEAFGPYAAQQTLDFAELRGASFFLITGPTGSGKTTVLDAMSFALYGVTSGGPESEGGRSGASMRSDHADPGLLTRVTFDFALGGDRYRIVREPEQERPKLRGDGVTVHGQSATLWRLRQSSEGLAEDGGPLETGWSKVSARSEVLLGFRAEQFRQVVMLPQGRFQRLLAADSREREQILRALFDTGHYSAVEAELKRAAKGLSDAAKTLRDKRAEALRQAEAETAEDLAERRARQALEAAEAAGHAGTAERARDEAQTRLQGGREAVARLDELAAAEAAAAAVAEREQLVAGARAELGAAEQAAAVSGAAARVAAARAGAAERRVAAEEHEAERLRRAEAAAEAAAALEKLEGEAEDREAAAAECLRLKGLVGATADLAAAAADAGDADVVCGEARRVAAAADADWTAARDAAAEAEAAWRNAQAGHLAAGLSSGEPCPVCGSTDHPSPATLPARAPGQDEVEALRTAADRASAARDAATRSLLRAESTAAAAAACLQERQKATAAEFADPAALQTAIATAEQRSAALVAAYRDASSAAQQTATAAATAATAAATSAAELVKADEEVRASCAELTERLSAAGFADEEAWLAACREPQQVGRLRELIADHAEAAARAAERLRLARAAAEGVTTPDLEALETAALAAAAEALSARTAAVELAAAADTASRQLERLEELEREAAVVHERYEVIGRLADVANGDNPRHLSFQRYVLGAFLDDVLVAASQRLHLMTKGRYRLERTERRFGGRSAAGLNLEVYDAWTGIARPVATLSGGESFMAALSLALGLAEVVQAHAGGIHLETVFVDEGFGSLDDESLDLAIAALMGLGEDGRLVGIISHVSELRERIDARLEITAGKTGSRADFRVA